jgi:hypothetical protein
LGKEELGDRSDKPKKQTYAYGAQALYTPRPEANSAQKHERCDSDCV